MEEFHKGYCFCPSQVSNWNVKAEAVCVTCNVYFSVTGDQNLRFGLCHLSIWISMWLVKEPELTFALGGEFVSEVDSTVSFWFSCMLSHPSEFSHRVIQYSSGFSPNTNLKLPGLQNLEKQLYFISLVSSILLQHHFRNRVNNEQFNFH